MSRRSVSYILVPLLVVTLAGCMGPTKTGLEAREKARARVNVINAQIDYKLAKQSFEVGQFEAAVRSIKIAIERSPQEASYLLLQGRIYLETYRLDLAIESFEAALELHAQLADAHYYAGIVYQRWSNDQLAYDQYRSAYELEPSKVQYLLAAAESLVAMREFERARHLTEEKLAYFEHNAALRHLLGQIALLQDEPLEAARHLAQARLLNPDDQILLEELARAQFAAGLYGKCYHSVRQSQLGSKEKRTDLIHIEARCLVFLDRTIEARKLYLELTRLRPTDPHYWVELGMVTWELGDFRRVAESGDRVAALAPERFEGYMLKALAARHEGDLQEAVTLLGRATDLASDTAVPHLLLGKTLQEKGDHQAALAAYAAAVRAEPDSPEARFLFEEVAPVPRLLTVEESSNVR